MADLRRDPAWAPPEAPDAWGPCAGPLETGRVPAPDTSRGLLCLAQMLAAGRVVPPWELDLSPADFADSFEMNLGYVDAFRLWLMSAFDDREHFRRCIGAAPPGNWEGWLAEHARFD